MTYRPRTLYPVTPTEKLLITTTRFVLRLTDRVAKAAQRNDWAVYKRLSRMRSLAWQRHRRILRRCGAVIGEWTL